MPRRGHIVGAGRREIPAIGTPPHPLARTGRGIRTTHNPRTVAPDRRTMHPSQPFGAAIGCLDCHLARHGAECGISSQQWNLQTKRRLTAKDAKEREGKTPIRE